MKHYLIPLSLLFVFLAAGCQKDEPEDIFNGHEYVDLGLPSGTLWATCNIGAVTPEGYGDYFSWGETSGYMSGKTIFDKYHYKWCDGSYYKLTKYCIDSQFGIVDNKIALELADDAARANWGGQWHMPSSEQMSELLSNCTAVFTTLNGVNGRMLTSKINGQSIFLPAAGCYWESLLEDGVWGCYWTTSLFLYPCYDAISLEFDRDDIEWLGNTRDTGLSIRPVILK